MSRRTWKAAPVLSLFLAAVSALAAAFPLTLKDQFGRTVVIPKEPQRIVSCSPAGTEVLYALGLGDRVVGVTNWCNYPEEAKKKPKIGDIAPVNIEKILSLRPDLVVAHELNGKEAVENLTSLGLPVLALRPTGFPDIVAAVELVGRATGTADQARAIALKLDATLAEVKRRGEALRGRNLKVFIMLGWDPVWTAGPGSYLDEAVTLAGGVNIAHDLNAAWAQMDLETIIKRNPDVIIADVDPAKVLADAAWSSVAAVQKKQVFHVVGDEYYRPGPRLIEALRDLVDLLERSR